MTKKESILLNRELTEKIIGAAYKVHSTLGPGFLEKVYENALAIELRHSGLKVEQQVSVTAYYEGQVVGEYQADLLVEGLVLVELKAIQVVNDAHHAQLRNYLRATGIQVGLLLNFGGRSLTFHRAAWTGTNNNNPRKSAESAKSAAKA